jgi:hypothetical protein
MRHVTPILAVLCLLLSMAVNARAEIYRWTDEKGTVHATADPGQIPEQYRDQLRKGALTPRGKLSHETAPPASPSPDAGPVQRPKAQDAVPAPKNPAPR